MDMTLNEGMPPLPVYSLFSGGKDSFATAGVLKENGLLIACLMLDTGISVPGWKESAIAICKQQGWPYEIIPTPVRYEWFVWKYGFPGPGMHLEVMTYLKGRCIREFKKAHKGMALASGVRIAESSRRSFNTQPISLFEGVMVYAPIYDWSDAETWKYCKAHGYERPLAYSRLQVSGDCLCGAYAREHERDAIKVHYPEVHERICKLETNTPHGKWGWGCDQERKLDPNQAVLCFDCSRTP